MKTAITLLFAALLISAVPAQDEPVECKQAREIRERLGDNLDGLMRMPADEPGKTTDSLITIRQWVAILEAKCALRQAQDDSLKNAQ